MRECAEMTTHDTNAALRPANKRARAEHPLAAVHLAAGATMGVWFGCVLPDYFSDRARSFAPHETPWR